MHKEPLHKISHTACGAVYCKRNVFHSGSIRSKCAVTYLPLITPQENTRNAYDPCKLKKQHVSFYIFPILFKFGTLTSFIKIVHCLLYFHSFMLDQSFLVANIQSPSYTITANQLCLSPVLNQCLYSLVLAKGKSFGCISAFTNFTIQRYKEPVTMRPS